MIKNYIFDFGNVLAEFDPIKLTQPYVRDDELCRVVSEVSFDRLYWDSVTGLELTLVSHDNFACNCSKFLENTSVFSAKFTLFQTKLSM